MKIAVVTSFYPSATAPHTGVPIFAQMPFLRELAEIRVICPRSTYPPLRFLQPRSYLYRHAADGYDLPGVDALHVPYYTLPVVGRALNGYLSGRAALPAVREFAPDVILSYTIYPDGYGALGVGKRLGIPVVLFGIGSDIRNIGDFAQKQLTRSALRRADYVLTVSHELRERALELGASAERSKAILNGCDTSIFRPMDRASARLRLGMDPNARSIMFVGRLVPLKGLRELLEALPRVAARFPEIEFTCIGEGPLGGELRERASRDDLAGRVRFIPSALPPRIAEWMAAADLTCLASYTEGCPNVIVESLACGRAVVATDVGGIPELVNAGNGVLVKPHDPQDLARGLIEAFERTWDEEEIARASRRSWKEVAEETVAVCRSAIRSSIGRIA
jgi:glycosyltransferase involved in cell wall biosynthesis